MSKAMFVGSRHVETLTSKDFDGVKTWHLKNPTCTFVLFYMPWCPHCHKVEPTWEALGKLATFFKIAAFDCEKNARQFAKIKEDLPQLVQSYPTMVFYKKGEPVETYDGDRTVKDFLAACMRVCGSR